MIDTGVQADLVHDHDPGVLALFLQLLHRRRDVRRGDDVFLVPDGRFDDAGMVDIRDEADDEVTLLECGVERIGRGGVDLDRLGAGELGDHLFGQFDGPATDGELVTLLDDVFDRGGGDEPGTEDEDAFGLCTGGSFFLHPRSDAGEIFLDEVSIFHHGPSEFGEDECGPVDVRVVILAPGYLSEGRTDAPLFVQRTTDEPDLPRGVRRDGRVRILGDGEESLGRLPQFLDEGQVQPQGLSLGGHVTSLLQGLFQEGKVRSLEQGRGGSHGVRRVGDDDVVFILVFGQKLEPVPDEHGHLGVLEDGAHVREVFLGHPDHGLVDITQGHVLDGIVLQDLPDHTTVSTTDDEDVLGVRVRGHGQVGDHLLVGEFITLRTLDDAVQDEDVAVGGRTKDEDVLVKRFFGMEDLFDLEGHGLACVWADSVRVVPSDRLVPGLTGPLRVDLPEPAV